MVRFYFRLFAISVLILPCRHIFTGPAYTTRAGFSSYIVYHSSSTAIAVAEKVGAKKYDAKKHSLKLAGKIQKKSVRKRA